MSDDAAPSNALFAPDSPIMHPRSLNRAENCADVAIPLIAAGGCRAVSAGVLAHHFGVTPAAALKWFGTTARMWEQLSDIIGRRWYSCLDRASRLETDTAPAPSYSETDVYQAVSLFLPLNEDEIEWTRVWSCAGCDTWWPRHTRPWTSTQLISSCVAMSDTPMSTTGSRSPPAVTTC